MQANAKAAISTRQHSLTIPEAQSCEQRFSASYESTGKQLIATEECQNVWRLLQPSANAALYSREDKEQHLHAPLLLQATGYTSMPNCKL